MSVVSRRIRSTPYRSGSETWDIITSILSPDPDSDARKDLDAVAGIACSLLSSEAMKDSAVVCRGAGPRVRIYCLFGEDAILGDDANESKLGFDPTDGDWSLSLPSPTEDLDWVKNNLQKKSSRVSARDLNEKIGPSDESESSSSEEATQTSVNREAFFRK